MQCYLMAAQPIQMKEMESSLESNKGYLTSNSNIDGVDAELPWFKDVNRYWFPTVCQTYRYMVNPLICLLSQIAENSSVEPGLDGKSLQQEILYHRFTIAKKCRKNHTLQLQ